MDTFWIGVTNLLTLAGLWTLFGVVRPSVINLLTLAGLWTLFGYKHSISNNPKLSYYYDFAVHLLRLAGLSARIFLDKPARVSRFMDNLQTCRISG